MSPCRTTWRERCWGRCKRLTSEPERTAVPNMTRCMASSFLNLLGVPDQSSCFSNPIASAQIKAVIAERTDARFHARRSVAAGLRPPRCRRTRPSAQNVRSGSRPHRGITPTTSSQLQAVPNRLSNRPKSARSTSPSASKSPSANSAPSSIPKCAKSPDRSARSTTRSRFKSPTQASST